MKKNIHPQYNSQVKVTCSSCNTRFTTGSVLDEINTEICSKCHPFYTGEKRIIDTDNLVSKFEQRKETAKKMSFRSKKAKMAARKKRDTVTKPSNTLTLKDMLSSIPK